MNDRKLTCDLLVAGAGISGICAAISAARHGLEVVLVNDRSVLGGNASSEIGVLICGASHEGLNAAVYAKETGIIEEIRLRAAHYNQGGYGLHALMDAVLFDMVYNEPNIRLIMNTIVYKCDICDGKITTVYARHSVNNIEYVITAPNYVDATGNGTLAYEAGAEYRIGREAKSEFGEFWAPEVADAKTMGNSIYFETEDAGGEVPFKAPDFAHDITKMDFLKDIHKPENFRGLSCYGPHWAYEYGGQIDILTDHDETELELRKLIYGIWDYIKNSGKYPQAKNRRLKRVYAKAGTRESRRFIGDYILTENDIENKVDFEDSVLIGGWPMDVHAPLGIYDTAPASNFIPVTGTYNIPFRCLYSKNIDNLMLAGRDISTSHIAFGSTRVMATCGAMGQAVGTAAALLKKYHVTPRELGESHMKELQGLLLRDDQTILHLCEDEDKDIVVEASGTRAYENVKVADYMPLERDYALALPVDSGRVDSLKVKLKVKEETLLRYRVLTGTHPETYLPERLVKEGELSLTEQSGEWVEIPLHVETDADRKLYLVLKENNCIEAAIAKERPLGVITFRMHTPDNCDKKNHDSIPLDYDATGYTHCDHFYEGERNLCFKDVEPRQGVYDAKNVVNGYNRPYGTQNIWMAEGSCMEYIHFYPNKDIDTLDILLNNDLHTEDYLKPIQGLAKNLLIEIWHRDGKQVIEVKDNYQRQITYRVGLSEVKRIKITIIDTYGANASIYAVRMYE